MNDTLKDAGGLLLAVATYVPLLLAPGAVLGAASDFAGFRSRSRGEQAGIALVLGLALMPLVDSSAVRFGGIGTGLFVTFLLDLAAIAIVVRARPSRAWLQGAAAPSAIAAVWLLLVILELVDVEWRGGLYPSLLIVDYSKHAATVAAIRNWGAPPIDPFFLRAGRAGYYYFLHTVGALSEALSGGAVDPRMAMGGLAAWTGLALFAMTRLLLERSGIGRGWTARGAGLILLVLLFARGLDILVFLKQGLLNGLWGGDPVWWTEQVTGWIASVLWVPQHVAGLIACFVGIVAVVDGFAAPASERMRSIVAVVLAGAAFASAFGMSLWVTFGAATTAAVWLGLLAAERRWSHAALLAAAGVAGLVMASPQILDLAHGRSGGGAPIALAVREFPALDSLAPSGPAHAILMLLALPVNYFAELGVFVSGAVLFWSRRRPSEVHRNELARVLTVSAVVGLVIGSFLRSTLYTNDLGWRVMLFPQLATLLWTAAALDDLFAANRSAARPSVRIPVVLLALGLLGYATTAYTLVQLRLYPWLPHGNSLGTLGRDPATTRELRAAYEWGGRALATNVVLQHDPGPGRVYDYALYSRNRVAVSDSFAALDGAPAAAVTERLNEIFPIFARGCGPADASRRARANGVDDLVVDVRDPVWSDPRSWVWTSRPVYASPRVRIIPVGALGDAP